MKRKIKATSIAGAVHAMKNVLAAPLPPPWPLTDEQQPIWDEVLTRRARDEWRPIDLRFAYQLAEVVVRLRAENRRLDEEGLVIESERGPVANPRHRIVQALAKQSLSLAVYLRVHPNSEVTHPTVVNASRRGENAARSMMPPPTADLPDFLAAH